VPASAIEEPPRVVGSAGPEVAVRVMCGPKPGTFLVNTHEVVCHCDECVRSHAETGGVGVACAAAAAHTPALTTGYWLCARTVRRRAAGLDAQCV
jgi:hypothetical protein